MVAHVTSYYQKTHDKMTNPPAYEPGKMIEVVVQLEMILFIMCLVHMFTKHD